MTSLDPAAALENRVPALSADRAAELFRQYQHDIHQRMDRLFAALMVVLKIGAVR